MKKVALLSMVLVLLLAAVGVGYAKWSKELQIEGNIYTGEVIVGFDNVRCVEVPEVEGKDVGYCDVSGEGDSFKVELFNAYPCYGVDVYYDINNLGTIPVKIEAIELVHVSVDGTIIPVGEPLQVCTVYGIDLDATTGSILIPNPTPEQLMGPDAICEFDIHVTGEWGVGTQIDPQGMLPGPDTIEGDLHVHLDQDAEMTTTYDFKIRIVASQWNEVP